RLGDSAQLIDIHNIDNDVNTSRLFLRRRFYRQVSQVDLQIRNLLEDIVRYTNAIDRFNLQASRISSLSFLSPIDCHTPFRVRFHQIQATFTMDGDATPPGYDALDFLTWYRLAAFCQVMQQPAKTADIARPGVLRSAHSITLLSNSFLLLLLSQAI